MLLDKPDQDAPEGSEVGVRRIAWDMNSAEENHLGRLPETVELWYVHSGLAEELCGTFYLNHPAALTGLAAYAHGTPLSVVEHVGICRARIIAIDHERQAAQVVVNQ